MRFEDRLLAYYEGRHDEDARLRSGSGRLEYVRTMELLSRFLPNPPARLIDVGGGTGTYSARLAEHGFDVELVDAVPTHVDLASRHGSFRARLGDARSLEAATDAFDAALLLGPLYHLRELDDRRAALREARRVVRPGGLVFAAFVSRSAILVDGFVRGWIDEPRAVEVMTDAARYGRTDRSDTGFNSISYLHLPSEARSELEDAGFDVVGLFGIEGPAWVAADFDERWKRPAGRAAVLDAARACEDHEELLGLSGHLLGVCRSPP